LACTQQQQEEPHLHLLQQQLLLVLLPYLEASWWFLSSSHAQAGRAAQLLFAAASRSTASAGARWTTCWSQGASEGTGQLRAALALCRSSSTQHVRGLKLWWVWHLRGLYVQQCSQLPHQHLVLVGCGLGLGVWQQVQGYLEGCLQQQQQRLRQQVCRLE
jgi:hypothetical protein